MFLVDEILKRLGIFQEDLPEEGYLAKRAAEVVAALPFPLVVCNKKFLIVGSTPAFNRLFKLGKKDLEGKPDRGKLDSGKSLFQILGSHVKLVVEGNERQITTFSEVIPQRNPKVVVGHFPKIGPRTFYLFTRRMPPNLLIAFQDVTEERKLKGMIEKSRSELLSVFDGIDDPMVMIDRNLKIRRINEAMLKIFRADSYLSFIGKACYWKLHGRRERCPDCPAGKVFATGKKTSWLGLIENSPQAYESSYQITHYPLRDSSGSVTGIAEFYRDITDVKRTEEELYESERSRVMEPLAAGIAHEIRNPLAIIQSTAQYCLGEIKSSSEGQGNGDLRESLQTIMRNTEQANSVISNLLDFARPSQSSFKKQPLRPLLRKALDLVRVRAESQRVRLVQKISSRLPPLILDEKNFMQAVMNFLMNSLDAMPEGGELAVEAARRNTHQIVITIRDSGVGIPEEVLPKIFQHFFTTKKGGVGLGLPIAEGIIRAQGGKVYFRSWKGKGTEVEIVFKIPPFHRP